MWPYTYQIKHRYYLNNSITVYTQLVSNENRGKIGNNSLLENQRLCQIVFWPEVKFLFCSSGSSFKEVYKKQNLTPWERAKEYLPLFIGTVTLGILILCFGILGEY